MSKLEDKVNEILGINEPEPKKEIVKQEFKPAVPRKDDELKRHKDRFSCEISTTMNLGGDSWPIYLEPSGKKNMNGIKVDLKPGDMLVYRGCDLEHWREPFKGDECVQVFLHYNNSKTPGAEENIFDKRPHLGLPSWFKKK